MTTTTSRWTTTASPLGPLTLHGGPDGLTALEFPGHGAPRDESARAPDLFAGAVAQLEAYFAGELRHFDLELDLRGTSFQRDVWHRLLEIPCGETISYGALARALGRPDSVRAVAAAVGRTPVPIIVPCHRVLAGDGKLTGYRGGLERKQALLTLEAHYPRGGAPKNAIVMSR